jgi:hypothetical protein
MLRIFRPYSKYAVIKTVGWVIVDFTAFILITFWVQNKFEFISFQSHDKYVYQTYTRFVKAPDNDYSLDIASTPLAFPAKAEIPKKENAMVEPDFASTSDFVEEFSEISQISDDDVVLLGKISTMPMSNIVPQDYGLDKQLPINKSHNVSIKDRNYQYSGWYDGDCFWRCVSYIESGDRSKEAAASYALIYMAGLHGHENAPSILNKEGAGISIEDAKNYAKVNSIGGARHDRIWWVNPDYISWYQYNGFHTIGGGHYIVYKSTNKNGSYNVYDPQLDVSFSISQMEAGDKDAVVLIN